MPTLPSISQTVITKATTLGYSRRLETFGSDITFKMVETLSVQVLAHNISNAQGVIPELSELVALQNSDDWSYVSINGRQYGNAKLIGFSLPEGNFAKTATCNLTFDIFSEGDDLASLGGYYSDYGSAFGVSTPFVDSLSESLSYSKGENSISYSKEISVKFSDSVQIVSSENGPVTAAQAFAKRIFDYDASSDYADAAYIGSESGIADLLDAGYRKIRSESINLINNECTFTESISAENVVGSYSHSATRSLQIDQNGIATVSEQGTVKGLTVPIMASANTGYDAEVESARTRMNSLFNAIADCGSLNTDGTKIRFVASTKTIRTEEGIIEYSVSADNDPRKDSGTSGVISEIVTQISEQNGFKQITENGTVTGMSHVKYKGSLNGFQRYPKYIQAKTYAATLIGGVSARVSALDANMSQFPVSRTETHSLFQGSISYSHAYSSEPKFAENSDYKQISVSFSDTQPLPKFNEFPIINESIVVQDLAGVSQGTYSTAVSIVGYRENPSHGNLIAARNKLLGWAKAKVETTNNHPSQISYSFSHLNNVNISLTAAYTTGMEEPQL
jgi:hypothetical protein